MSGGVGLPHNMLRTLGTSLLQMCWKAQLDGPRVRAQTLPREMFIW